MAWFWKKRKSEEVDVYQRELLFINQNLRDSFSKIKQDMKLMKDWISHLNDRDREKGKNLELIESRLDEMGEALSYSVLAKDQASLQTSRQPVLEETIPERGVPTPSSHLQESSSEPEAAWYERILDDLTDTQKSIFYRAGTMLKEAGQSWISIKSLASDLYPSKPYDQIRSTASEYVGILVDSGLLEKRRKGKQTYIGLTKKGESFFTKTKQETVDPQEEQKRR